MDDNYDDEEFETYMEEVNVEDYMPNDSTEPELEPVLNQFTDQENKDDIDLNGLNQNDSDVEDMGEDGQKILGTLLNQIDTRTSELIINNTLSGTIDFSILADRGFECIKRIVFSKRGHIKQLLNLPKDLIVLECPEQKIKTLGGIGGKMPPRLEELICYDNELEELDLSDMQNLIRLNVNGNRLKSLQNIPNSLKELYVNDNRLESLNLINAVQLNVLHISNNSGHLVIQHLPSASLVDFKSENTHLSSFLKSIQEESASADQKSKISKQIKYEEALEKYFELKQKYDNRQGKCPKCEKKGEYCFLKGKTDCMLVVEM